MKTFLPVIFLLGHYSNTAQEMTTYLSPYSHEITLDRFRQVLESKELKLFDVIDHQQTAKNIGEILRPTSVVIFEDPHVGTRWLQCEQTVAIDLPFKVLIWEDEGGDTFLSYTNPRLIAKRHHVNSDCPELINELNKTLVRVINETIKIE